MKRYAFILPYKDKFSNEEFVIYKIAEYYPRGIWGMKPLPLHFLTMDASSICWKFLMNELWP